MRILGFASTRRIATAIVGVLLTTGVAQATPIQWTVGSGGNGHYYEWISGTYSWTTARANALASTHLGMSGYLATLTSAPEQSFLLSVSTSGWMGGSDAAVEGIWKWMDGPEAGNTFWTGGPGGTPTGFASWNTNEPNNSGNEDFLDLQGGRWNDLPNTNATFGYFVEFGPAAVPEPASLTMLGLGALSLIGYRLRRRKPAVEAAA